MPATTDRPGRSSTKPTRDQTDRFRWLVANAAWKTAGANAVDAVTRAVSLLKLRTMTRDQIQWIIDRLAALPLRGIPDGMYRLGEHHYRLRTAVDGRWAGFTGVYAVNDTGEQVPLRGQQRRGVLAALRDTHFEAAARFGQQTQRCPYCNQQLEDPVSRRVGVGPNCAAARAIAWK